jgi:hypothetical protein
MCPGGRCEGKKRELVALRKKGWIRLCRNWSSRLSEMFSASLSHFESMADGEWTWYEVWCE